MRSRFLKVSHLPNCGSLKIFLISMFRSQLYQAALGEIVRARIWAWTLQQKRISSKRKSLPTDWMTLRTGSLGLVIYKTSRNDLLNRLSVHEPLPTLLLWFLRLDSKSSSEETIYRWWRNVEMAKFFHMTRSQSGRRRHFGHPNILLLLFKKKIKVNHKFWIGSSQ